MRARKLVGVIGSGLIGTDPFHERAWSGSSKFFFEKCRENNLLERAFGCEARSWVKYSLMLRNFSIDRERWRQKFYLDTRYYKALTDEISGRILKSDLNFNFFQIGGIYNLPEIIKGKTKCFSYHDGNLAQFVRSPYMPMGISKNLISKALQYEKEVYGGLDKIFTMSEYLRKSFIDDFEVDPSKVVCIGAGVNISSVPEYVKKDYGNNSVLFVGIRFYRKGGMDLLEAFRLVRTVVPSATLHIVGPQKLKIPNELSKGVRYHGFLSKKQPEENRLMEELLRRASLFVMPSLYEPFGIAPLEAMINQVPCILTNEWAFPEMVESGVNGELVEHGDIEDLAEKIIFLLSDPELLKKMGDASRNKVLQKYTWSNVVSSLKREISF